MMKPNLVTLKSFWPGKDDQTYLTYTLLRSWIFIIGNKFSGQLSTTSKEKADSLIPVYPNIMR